MPEAAPIRDRRSAAHGHILIGGPGRSGTTLLVQYFTALGFDTGFGLEESLTRVDPISRGGLEHSLGRTLAQGRPMPYVAKSPFFGPKLGDFLANGTLRVNTCIIAVRDLDDAARSRQLASERAVEAGGDYDAQAGGMQGGARDLVSQKRRLAVRFYGLVTTLAEHGVSMCFVPFPQFARDPGLCFERLEGLLVEHGVSRAESDRAHARVVDASLIHGFTRD